MSIHVVGAGSPLLSTPPLSPGLAVSVGVVFSITWHPVCSGIVSCPLFGSWCVVDVLLVASEHGCHVVRVAPDGLSLSHSPVHTGQSVHFVGPACWAPDGDHVVAATSGGLFVFVLSFVMSVQLMESQGCRNGCGYTVTFQREHQSPHMVAMWRTHSCWSSWRRLSVSSHETSRLKFG